MIDWKYYYTSQLAFSAKFAADFKKWFKQKENQIREDLSKVPEIIPQTNERQIPIVFPNEADEETTEKGKRSEKKAVLWFCL